MTSWWPAAALALVLAGGYAAAWWRRPRTLPAWSPWRIVAWVLGTGLAALAISPVLGEGAHHDHRFHMAQHLALGMYAPLALVLAAPMTLVLGSLPRRAQLGLTGLLRRRPVQVLTHPASAAVLNIGGMFLLYLTPLYGLSMKYAGAHWLMLAHFLLAGWLYTWAIAGPDPAPGRPRMRTRLSVLIIAAGAHAFLAKLLYANAHRFTIHDAHSLHHGVPSLPDDAPSRGTAPSAFPDTLTATGRASTGDVGAAIDIGVGPIAQPNTATMETAAQWMYYGGDIAEVVLAIMLFTWWLRRRDRLLRSVRPPRPRPAGRA
ncbi:MAG TPA: cytochrome c oxidase assembly protein [Beutenbergiaceae bacterium]|nr:cytochrome c oxidase assembly protein [Beutenbergiaceae bacterium]